jgi:L-ascorbate metabolism protein UlaG (beta-lactamase superfamily)
MKRLVRILLGAAGAGIAGVVAFGWSLSAPRYRGETSDHFDGKRFHNLTSTKHAGFLDLLRWMATRDHGPWDRWRKTPPGPPPPQRVDGDALRITFINHSTLLIQTASVNILTDPIWSERCSPVGFAGPVRHHPPGIRLEDLPPIDAVLISHNHYDHLDVPTLRQLRPPRILTGLGNGAFLAAKHIEHVTELDWWQSAELAPGIRIHAVPAQHFSSRGFGDRDANLWCGFVLETPGATVYFAGDTGWGEHFAEIRKRFGPPRVALLPIGAFRPEWFMCAVHISPADAVRAAAALGAKLSIPMHYGTFDLGDDGQDEPVRALDEALAHAPQVRFAVLPPGGFTEP